MTLSRKKRKAVTFQTMFLNDEVLGTVQITYANNLYAYALGFLRPLVFDSSPYYADASELIDLYPWTCTLSNFTRALHFIHRFLRSKSYLPSSPCPGSPPPRTRPSQPRTRRV